MKFESKALEKLYNHQTQAHMLVQAARGKKELRVLGSYDYVFEHDDEGNTKPTRRAILYIPASELVKYGVKPNKLHPFNFSMIYEFRLCYHDSNLPNGWENVDLSNAWIDAMSYTGVLHTIEDNDSSYDFYINMYPECEFKIDNANRVYNTGRCPFYE